MESALGGGWCCQDTGIYWTNVRWLDLSIDSPPKCIYMCRWTLWCHNISIILVIADISLVAQTDKIWEVLHVAPQDRPDLIRFQSALPMIYRRHGYPPGPRRGFFPEKKGKWGLIEKVTPALDKSWIMKRSVYPFVGANLRKLEPCISVQT